VLLIGPPGVGKAMLATTLGYKTVEAGYRAYYTTAADRVARMTKAALEGRWETTMRFCNGPQLLIIGELGHLPMPAEAASHLFRVVNPPLRTRLDRAYHQPAHRRLGTDLPSTTRADQTPFIGPSGVRAGGW